MIHGILLVTLWFGGKSEKYSLMGCLNLTKTHRACELGFDQGRIQDLIRGGPDRDRPKLPTVHSSFMRAKQALFSMGSRAHLRAPEALGYFITKYAFSPFRGTFLYYF